MASDYVNNKLPGYFFTGDYHSIKDIVTKLPETGVLVEIGTFLGRSATFWAEAFREQKKKYKILCLDLFENDGERIWNDHLTNKFAGDIKTVIELIKNTKTNYEIVCDMLSKYPEIECYKFDLLKNTPRDLGINEATCIFEDALHTREGVKKCLTDWYPILKSNGIYCGHDYNPNEMDVMIEVNSFALENNLKVVKPRLDSSVYYYEKTHE